jgi:hypothetical protein
MAIVLNGATSGNVTIDANAISGTSVITLPVGSGTFPLMNLSTTVATTSGTAIDFTSIPSWVKRITINLNGVSTNGTSALIAQTGSGTFDTSGYAALGTILIATSGTAGQTNTNGHLLDMTRVAGTDTTTGSIVLNQIATNVWASSGITYRASGTTANYILTGNRSTSSTLDRIRITTVGGTDTFDAGSVNILMEGY